MVYLFPFSIPANTSITTPLIQEKVLTFGIIKRIDIYFPPGCIGLVNIAIFRFNTQVFPRNINEYFSGDNKTISFQVEISLEDRPYSLKIKGYNLDDTYSHKIQIFFQVEIPETTTLFLLPSTSNELIKELEF